MKRDLSNPIFNIQRFSLHDGEGIRTLIFLRGCPLRCLWCANPEGLDKNCQAKIMSEEELELYCKDIMTEVMKDQIFFEESGGGVTLSGGEPTFNFQLAIKLVTELKKYKIKSAIESCGYSSYFILLKLAKEIDHLFYDLKVMDEKEHMQLTGQSNKIILANLQNLFQDIDHQNLKLGLTVRYPLIPKINDNEDNQIKMAKFLSPWANRSFFKGVEILPYHKLAINKYKMMNKSYQMDDTIVPYSPTEFLNKKEELRRVFLKYQVKII